MSRLNQITLKLGREIIFVSIENIVVVKAENIYCSVFLSNGQTLLVSNTLKEISEKLMIKMFVKPHRSYIINTNYIERYNKTDLLVYLKTIANPVPVSRNIKIQFEERIL